MGELENTEISLAEMEARSMLESALFLDLPDIQIEWRYHPVHMEHTCRISKQRLAITYTFSPKMLQDISGNPDATKGLIQGIVSEIKRRLL